MNTNFFKALELKLAETLAPEGFTQSRREVNGPFDSYFSDFVSGERAYRLIADGKESSVFLDFSANYNSNLPCQYWKTVIRLPFPSRYNAQALIDIWRAIAQGFGEFRASPQA
jgi:hypothetical protein